MEHRARKRFGQNFLHDPYYVRACIDAIAPQPDDRVVEIGPGLGALTEPLLARLPHLHVVEIDRDLIARLHQRHPPERLTIHEGDALKFDFASVGDGLRIVGNLPYNISTPLLFHLCHFADRIRDLHFMLQKEVVMRMVAAPSTPEYGRLSVMLGYRFDMERLFDVPGGAFQPPPKVTSAFVRLRPRVPLPYPAHDEIIFAKIVASAFSTRRKTLRNTLKPYFTATDFERLGIDGGLRAENLGVAEFVTLANAAAEQGGGAA
jgi:16S rRNA (adenine1518-N6/adenine1519-N6)-dimethyltransferase